MSVNICNVDFEAAHLPLISTIGFEGKVVNGLHVDPTGQYLVYAIGTNVIKADTCTGRQTFMIGHTNNITCIDLDKAGKFIVSGQMNFIGFPADVIIWDFGSGCKLGQYSNHLTRVNTVCFSFDGRYVLSCGNLDDANICIYDITRCKVICGAASMPGSAGIPLVAAPTNRRNDCWIVGGEQYLYTWMLTSDNRLKWEKANVKKVKRTIDVVCIDHSDDVAYCATATGDIMKVKLYLPPPVPPSCGGGCDRLGPPAPGPIICTVVTRWAGPCERGRNTHLYKGGITAMKILASGDFIIGTGAGVVTQARLKMLCRRGETVEVLSEYGSQMCVRGAVTSIVTSCETVLVGSTMNEVTYAKLGCLDSGKMLASGHYSVVNDIAFPCGYSQVFASCNFEDIRIWNSAQMREIVRINVANTTCNTVAFAPDGRSVVSGWNDSHIRTYTPQTGTPLWVIYHAHLRGVTALAIFSDSRYMVSGGEDGQLRLWGICPQQQTPIAIMKEHLGPVTGLRLRSNDLEVASSSGDGSIVIWCLRKFSRKAIVQMDTLFLDLSWHPNECQIVGVTFNHKLGYFEAYDGSSIREITASETDAVHSVDVSSDGLYIVTAGADRQVKLWSYKESKLLRKGVVHSDEVVRVRFSPCSDYILSCCRDGSIFKWEFPKDLACVSVSIVPTKCHGKFDQPAITDGQGYPGLPMCQ